MEILLRNVGAGVLSLDRDLKIRTVNRFFEDLFGTRFPDLLGSSYEALFAGDAMRPIRELIEEANQKRWKTLDRRIWIPLGEEPRNLSIRVSGLEDEEGAWMGVVMVFEDQTDLIRAQRAAAWREVARRIAHEIKNPLTPIQLSAQRLQKRYASRLQEDGKIFEECTSTIIRQVEEMKNLVNEFSNFARMPAAKPALSDLNEIVREVLVLYQEAHRSILFRFEEDAKLPLLLLDPDQIRRVLINLLDNAVHAIHGSGQIEVVSRHDPFLNMGVLEVSDDGSGIPREIRERLFEPYTSTKKGGTGLGLAIVKTIVSDHNGYVRVRDNSPHGTKFVLEFPVPIT
jgi:two-component system nitrogen regulation sensor histidine kinase NtrY